MEVLKRPRQPSVADAEIPPAKIAKQFADLNLDEARLESDMEGVEARDFTHLTYDDWVNAINEIEIDDRFTKIPKHVTDSPTADYFQRPSNALIPYTKPKGPPVEPKAADGGMDGGMNDGMNDGMDGGMNDGMNDAMKDGMNDAMKDDMNDAMKDGMSGGMSGGMNDDGS